MTTKTDIRQFRSRDLLNRITGLADSQLDNIIRALDIEVTPPLAMNESSTPDLVLHIGNITVQNPDTLIKKTIPPISDIMPSFASGTVTFPSSSGGNAVPSIGNNFVITISSGNYLKVGISLDNSGNIVLNSGTQGASEAATTVPPAVTNTFSIGFVTLHNLGGTIQNITNPFIYQFVGGGGGGGTSGYARIFMNT